MILHFSPTAPAPSPLLFLILPPLSSPHPPLPPSLPPQIEVPASASCVDVFTSLPIPYSLDGDMPDPRLTSNFVVTPVTKLVVAQSSTTTMSVTDTYAYFIPRAQLPSDPTVLNADALSLMGSSASTALPSGGFVSYKDLGANVYLTDVQVSSTCLVLGSYALAKRPATFTGSACATLDAVVDYIYTQFSLTCKSTATKVCTLSSTSLLQGILGSTLSACGAASGNSSESTAVVNALASINSNLVDTYSDVDVLPIQVVIYAAKVSKVVQSDVVTVVRSSTPASVSQIVGSGWDARVNAAPVNSNAVLAAMGLAPLPTASASNGTTFSMGPVVGLSTISYKNLLDFSQTTGLTSPNYLLPAATWGMFTVPKGGVDLWLNTSQPTDTLVMTPYPRLAQAQLSPGGALTTAYFLYNQATDAARYMTADYYSKVFGLVLGASFGVSDCSARSWAAGSAQQVGAYVVDIYSNSVPTLLAQLVGGMVNGTGSPTVSASMDDMALTVYMDLAQNLTSTPITGRNVFFSASDIATMAYNLYYNAYTSGGDVPTPTTPRLSPHHQCLHR